MKFIIDGNDGTGKTTLINGLRKFGVTAELADRGLPTKMTDDPTLEPSDDEFYFILDVDVETSRARLAEAGKDLNEKYHTVEDLTFYRKRFLEVAKQLGRRCLVVDATQREEMMVLIVYTHISYLSLGVWPKEARQ